MIILRLLKMFLGIVLVFFLILLAVEIDIGGVIKYDFLIEKAVIMSLKYYVIILPVYFLFFYRKD